MPAASKFAEQTQYNKSKRRQGPPKVGSKAWAAAQKNPKVAQAGVRVRVRVRVRVPQPSRHVSGRCAQLPAVHVVERSKTPQPHSGRPRRWTFRGPVRRDLAISASGKARVLSTNLPRRLPRSRWNYQRG